MLKSQWPIGLGRAFAIAITGLFMASMIALAMRAESFAPSAADWAAVRFSVVQALISAAVSTLVAVPIARALARRRFWGRTFLVAALGAPFLLPVIVAILGLLAVLGRSGLMNQGLDLLGLPRVSIYGFHGVILAHVFLNLPLAVRMLLQGWSAIPAERIRLAQSLDLGAHARFRHLELPMLRLVLPGIVLAIFLICLTSFTVVLILGGGPKATSVELAIYQAIRFDFDLGRAAVLAAIQFGLCASAVLLAGRFTADSTLLGQGLDRSVLLPADKGLQAFLDAGWILLATVFLFAPLTIVIWRGIAGITDLPLSVWYAALTSLLMALATAALTGLCTLALGFASTQQSLISKATETAGMLPMAASGLVLGTGLFILLHPFISPDSVAMPIAVLVNSLMALPFALRLILPAWRQAEATQGRLADSLDLQGFDRFRVAIYPRIKQPFGFAIGLSAALAMGDVGVIALFSSDQGATLPLQVWRLMGAYRSTQAEGAALLLVILSFGFVFMFDAWGRRNVRA